MESLGQTLCQLEKTFLNQQLESDAEFFQRKTRKKTVKKRKNPGFCRQTATAFRPGLKNPFKSITWLVARQRQHSGPD